MKLLFFLVALANVAFFMWEYKTGGLAPVKAPTLQSAAPAKEPILMVSELPPPIQPEPAPATTVAQPEATPPAIAAQAEPVPATPQTPAATEPAAEQAVQKPLRCYEVGALTKAQSWQLLRQFTNADTTVEPIKKDEQTPVRYMVYYPAGQTLAESEANLLMLKGRGVTDLYILRKDKEKGDISLGVFSKEERAVTLKEQMLAKGITVNIKTLYKTKAVQYALIKSREEITGQLDALQKNTPQLTVKEIFPCD